MGQGRRPPVPAGLQPWAGAAPGAGSTADGDGPSLCRWRARCCRDRGGRGGAGASRGRSGAVTGLRLQGGRR